MSLTSESLLSETKGDIASEPASRSDRNVEISFHAFLEFHCFRLTVVRREDTLYRHMSSHNCFQGINVLLLTPSSAPANSVNRMIVHFVDVRSISVLIVMTNE